MFRQENRGLWRLVEENPVNDGVVFWIRPVADDLAVKILSDTPAGGVLSGHPKTGQWWSGQNRPTEGAGD